MNHCPPPHFQRYHFHRRQVSNKEYYMDWDLGTSGKLCCRCKKKTSNANRVRYHIFYRNYNRRLDN